MKEAEPIKVPPESALGRLLDDAAERPVLLEKDGVRYRVTRVDGDPLWASYDPSAVRAALAATAGSWTALDAERLKAQLYRRREEGTRAD